MRRSSIIFIALLAYSFVIQRTVAGDVIGLTPWAKERAYRGTVEQFLEWNKENHYQIKGIYSDEVRLRIGQIAQEVILVFSEYQGCEKRLVKGLCAPILLTRLVCSYEMTDCYGKTVQRRVGIIDQGEYLSK